jgi:hypothetical protein
MAVFLLLPEASALWRFFVLHVPAQLSTVWLPRSERRWLRITSRVVQAAIVVSVLGSNIWGGYTGYHEYADLLKPPPLFGIWDVDAVQGGGADPASQHGGWRRLIFSSERFMTIVAADGERISLFTAYAEPQHRLSVRYRGSKTVGDLTYAMQDEQHLELRGSLDRSRLAVRAHRYAHGKFALTTRGFHWISEDPYNR